MKTIDLRSDTVTLPTENMRRAISEAELGDDVFSEDPTVNKLEKLAAEKVGKESALFVPTGSMANLTSVLSHCSRGDEVILGDQSHIFCYECGSVSAVGSIMAHTIPNQPDGTLKIQDIKNAVRADNVHFPQTKLICLENTHNRCSGSPVSAEYTQSVSAVAKENGLALHIDGARIFNAAAALGCDVKDITAGADSVSFCLSKGLCCPAGSMVCGSESFINKARRNRKMLGGGMRQAGILAAAGIEALNNMIERLTDDHANAKLLAQGIADIRQLSIETNSIRTNIIYFSLNDCAVSPEQLLSKAAQKGPLFLSTGPNSFRMVTHYGINAEDITATVKILNGIFSGI